jgi:hypothetical protein
VFWDGKYTTTLYNTTGWLLLKNTHTFTTKSTLLALFHSRLAGDWNNVIPKHIRYIDTTLHNRHKSVMFHNHHMSFKPHKIQRHFYAEALRGPLWTFENSSLFINMTWNYIDTGKTTGWQQPFVYSTLWHNYVISLPEIVLHFAMTLQSCGCQVYIAWCSLHWSVLTASVIA